MEMKLLLVHRIMLYTRSLYWLIHDNYIIDTLPDSYLACYRLAHDDDKCSNFMLQLLHRIDIDCFRFEFSFLLISSSLPIWVSIRVHNISWFCGLYNLLSFANYSCILVLIPDPQCRSKHVLFTTAKLVSK